MDDRHTIDLGSGVSLRWTGIYGLDEPPDWPHFGAIVLFELPGEEPCEGSITFDHPLARDKLGDQTQYWAVQNWKPLTLTPSVACTVHPHHHGFVTDGRWVSA